jgi:hypothetical protein
MIVLHYLIATRMWKRLNECQVRPRALVLRKNLPTFGALHSADGHPRVPISKGRLQERFVMSRNRGVVYKKPGEVQLQGIADPKFENLQGRKIELGVILKVISTNICEFASGSSLVLPHCKSNPRSDCAALPCRNGNAGTLTAR